MDCKKNIPGIIFSTLPCLLVLYICIRSQYAFCRCDYSPPPFGTFVSNLLQQNSTLLKGSPLTQDSHWVSSSLLQRNTFIKRKTQVSNINNPDTKCQTLLLFKKSSLIPFQPLWKFILFLAGNSQAVMGAKGSASFAGGWQRMHYCVKKEERILCTANASAWRGNGIHSMHTNLSCWEIIRITLIQTERWGGWKVLLGFIIELRIGTYSKCLVTQP